MSPDLVYVDPTLEGLYKSALVGLHMASPRDLTPLVILGDWYEEHGDVDSAIVCRVGLIPCVPLIHYLRLQGMAEFDAALVRAEWLVATFEPTGIFRRRLDD